MKNNIWQIITIGLCVVLLVAVIIQGKKIDELSQKLDVKVNNLRYDLQNEVTNITNIVRSELEESDRIVLKSELKPSGINKDTKKLLANVTVNLKEWHEDTEVTLYMTIADEKMSAVMTSDGNGAFSTIVDLPCDVDAHNVIELDALVTGGGLTKKESLGVWGDISMLLPLWSNGSAWSGPTYKDGVLNAQFSISMAGQNGASAEVINPEFWVYRNGEVVQKIKAVQTTDFTSGGNNFAINTEESDTFLNIECEPGDNIDIRFRCEDTYGLGYDFLFADWVALHETDENTQSAGVSQGTNKALILYWPE